ncbi:MAG: hypothetical protein QOH88_1948 [Verrucomicrobiota bacterium]|jgi:hypothetical protein
MASAWQADTRQTEADLKTPRSQGASHDWRRGSLRLKPEPVVLFVCADPKPRDYVTVAHTYGGSGLQSARHRSCYAAPRIAAKDDEGLASRARISLALASGSQSEAHQNISRTANASCRSRQILKAAGANIRANVFGDAVQASTFRKVGVDLAIPRGLIPLANEGSELGELFRGKGIHSHFYFRKTHA